MSLFVPMNFDPVSTTIKTGAYTVPTGKFAKVEVSSTHSGNFTIDSAIAIPVSVVDTEAVNQTSGSYSIPIDRNAIVDVYFFLGSAGTLTFSNSAEFDGFETGLRSGTIPKRTPSTTTQT